MFKIYLGANIEIVHSICSHEGHLTVGVGVDAAGDDELARGVDDPGAPGDLEVEADLLDGPVLDVNIRSLSAIFIDHLAPLDEDPVKMINKTGSSNHASAWSKTCFSPSRLLLHNLL